MNSNFLNKKKILLGALAALSLLVWVRALKAPAQSKRAMQGVISASAAQERQPLRTAYKDWKRDPFSPERMLDSTSLGLQLLGIIYDNKEKYALINDQVVHIGEEVDGNKIIDIRKNAVILNDGEKDFELKLE